MVCKFVLENSDSGRILERRSKKWYCIEHILFQECVYTLPLHHSFFKKVLMRFFLFARSAKGKSEHKKFWKRMEGVPPSLKLRRTRQGNGGSRARQGDSRQSPGGTFAAKGFSFPPCRQGAARRLRKNQSLVKCTV